MTIVLGAAVVTLALVAVLAIHEMGHYVAAVALGAPVRSVSIGIGPSLLHWRNRTGVEWRIAAIPLLAWVSYDPSTRVTVPPWGRAVIAASGPIASIVAGVGLGVVHGIGASAADGPYAMMMGALRGWTDAWTTIGAIANNIIATVMALLSETESQMPAGANPLPMGGPGWWNALLLASVMSLGIGVVNLAPLPIMDGGQIVILGLEAVFGPRVSRWIEQISIAIVGAILLGLVCVSR